MKVSQIVAAWNEFFFKPQSPLPMAVFRILYALLILGMLLFQLGPDFGFWYGPHGIVAVESVRSFFWQNFPLFDFMTFAGSNGTAYLGFFWLAVTAAVCLLVGFGTRYSALFVFLALQSMHQHDPFNTNGGDCYLRLCAFYLCFSQAGQALSVDRWWNEKYHPERCKDEYWPWAQRLLQIQIAIVYWQTSLVKLSGEQWINGSAIYYATRLEDLYHFPLPFLYDSIFACQLLTWFTLIVEISMWTLVWVKEFRYWVLLAAVCLHLGIDYSINLPFFEWAFMATFVCFIEPSDLSMWWQYAVVRFNAMTRNKKRDATVTAPAADSA